MKNLFKIICLLLTLTIFSSFTSQTQKSSDLDEYIQSINQCIIDITEHHRICERPRLIDAKAVRKLMQLFDSGKVMILMRHGEQQMSQRVKSLPNKALQKIAMMRMEENTNNPLTEHSQIELYGTVAVIDYIKAYSKVAWRIETSSNRRAYQAANLIGDATNIPVTNNSIWDCVNYPEESIISTKNLLEILPNGSLPWDLEVVNRVIGPGTYEKIHRDVNVASKSLHDKECLLCISHTQQLNALAEQKNLPIIRLGYYGFIVITDDSRAEIFPNGIYQY